VIRLGSYAGHVPDRSSRIRWVKALDIMADRSQVPDQFLITCPYCGEQVEIYVEPDVRGAFIQDCEVCCNPWRVRVSGRDGNREVDVTRADGSE
jgi:cysteine-rich CPXCG protein